MSESEKQIIFNRYQKKLSPDSRRKTATTQTQNKTRQNYYAIMITCPMNHGNIFVSVRVFTYP